MYIIWLEYIINMSLCHHTVIPFPTLWDQVQENIETTKKEQKNKVRKKKTMISRKKTENVKQVSVLFMQMVEFGMHFNTPNPFIHFIHLFGHIFLCRHSAQI